MQLADYLREENITYGEFARRIEVKNARTVQRYVAKKRIPSPPIMARISRETGGKVGAADFYDAPVLQDA